MLTSVTPRGLGFLRDLPTGTKRFVFKISFVFVRFGGNVGAGSTEFRNTQFSSMYSVKSSLSLKHYNDVVSLKKYHENRNLCKYMLGMIVCRYRELFVSCVGGR